MPSSTPHSHTSGAFQNRTEWIEAHLDEGKHKVIKRIYFERGLCNYLNQG